MILYSQPPSLEWTSAASVTIFKPNLPGGDRLTAFGEIDLLSFKDPPHRIITWRSIWMRCLVAYCLFPQNHLSSFLTSHCVYSHLWFYSVFFFLLDLFLSQLVFHSLLCFIPKHLIKIFLATNLADKHKSNDFNQFHRLPSEGLSRLQNWMWQTEGNESN